MADRMQRQTEPCLGCGSLDAIQVDFEGRAVWCACGRLNCTECGEECEPTFGEEVTDLRHVRDLDAPRCTLHRQENVRLRRASLRVIQGGRS